MSEWQLERINMRYLFGFALLLPIAIFAKDPPLPQALLSAKTAFVEKVGTAEDSFDKLCKEPNSNAGTTEKEPDKFCKSLKKEAKADKQLFDNFCKELKKWGRFELVQDRSSADVRILLGRTGSTRKTSSVNTAPIYGADNPPNYPQRTIRGNLPPTEFNKANVIVGGKLYSIDTSPVYAAPSPSSSTPSMPAIVQIGESVIINIRDRQNDALLYVGQMDASYLVSYLKKSMKRE
jgi:hypothetical protein